MTQMITVYGVPGSPYGRAVLSTLEEKHTRCQFVAVPPGGGMRSAAHLARHPFGRVPVLQHGDFSLRNAGDPALYRPRPAGRSAHAGRRPGGRAHGPAAQRE